MQVPKYQVRQNILDAALEEFSAKGYKHASIRNIATQAGITPGNIYSYFPSKEKLFDVLLQPTATRIKAISNLDFPNSTLSTLELVIDAIVALFREEKQQVMILLNGSEGSPFAEIGAGLYQIAAERIREYLPTYPNGEPIDPLFARALAVAVIDGLIILINECAEHDRLSRMVSEFLRQIFSGIAVMF